MARKEERKTRRKVPTENTPIVFLHGHGTILKGAYGWRREHQGGYPRPRDNLPLGFHDGGLRILVNELLSLSTGALSARFYRLPTLFDLFCIELPHLIHPGEGVTTVEVVPIAR